MPDNNSMGIAGGLTTMRSSGDSTQIPLQIRALMAKRREQNKTPIWSREDSIKSINEGKENKSKLDTSMVKKSHDEWLKHIDALGYEVRKKSQ